MDGILIIDKDKGYTSRDVVNIIGKSFKTKKAGHTGTLDPLATGVLVVGINKATKILELLFSDDKEYIAEVKFGIETDTLDIEGNIINEDYNYSITKQNVIDVLNSFQGKYMQEVPKYSAVKINGKKLYEYARNNIDIELPKKEVNIKKIELLEYNQNGFSFKCTVSKGTYIRSLIKDIGNKLNIYCTMNNLRRIRQGIFNIKDAITINDIKNNNYKILSIKDALSHYKQIEVNDKLKFKISNGQKIKLDCNETIIIFTYKNKVIGIYIKEDNIYKPYKIINEI